MELLEKKILSDGKVAAGDVLNVSRFLNHMVDVDLLQELGTEFCRLFADCGITKILTVEASGIGLACFTALGLHVPVLYAKKSKTKNINAHVYSAMAHSYTHGNDNLLCVDTEYLLSSDKVLIVDDFLATGCALNALIDIIGQAGAELVGIGIAVEKVYQNGGNELRKKGIRVESLARVTALDENGVTFAAEGTD